MKEEEEAIKALLLLPLLQSFLFLLQSTSLEYTSLQSFVCHLLSPRVNKKGDGERRPLVGNQGGYFKRPHGM